LSQFFTKTKEDNYGRRISFEYLRSEAKLLSAASCVLIYFPPMENI